MFGTCFGGNPFGEREGSRPAIAVTDKKTDEKSGVPAHAENCQESGNSNSMPAPKSSGVPKQNIGTEAV